VVAKSLAAFLVIPLAALATLALAGFSPFLAAWTIPMNRCCFLDVAGMFTILCDDVLFLPRGGHLGYLRSCLAHGYPFLQGNPLRFVRSADIIGRVFERGLILDQC